MSEMQKLIESEDERQEALQEIEAHWDSVPGTPEADRLKLLATLVELYEKGQFRLVPPDPVMAIRFRMEQAGLKRRDLEPILGGRNRVSEILNGVRDLSKAMIIKLHSELGIPLESLLGTAPRARRRTAARVARAAAAGHPHSRGRRAARSRRRVR